MRRTAEIMFKFVFGILPPTAILSFYFFLNRGRRQVVPEVAFSQFLKDAQSGHIAKVLMDTELFEVTLRRMAPNRIHRYITRMVPVSDTNLILDLLRKFDVTFELRRPHWIRNMLAVFLGIIPFLYGTFLLRYVSNLNDSNNIKKDYVGKESRGGSYIHGVNFDDIQGVDSAKEELVEVVNFLKDPAKYWNLGARLPKGILLSGPSGTGKTLLARAVAAESHVPFISCSASDFVEMLVGRGASRVRELFKRGAKCSPCIIFIDELDALAKSRGGLNSNDEREQTLNQLLTEMDGFESNSQSLEAENRAYLAKHIVVIAATNRPEVLDSALTRPGRFDRHIYVGLPSERGREKILQVHAKRLKMGEEPDFSELARRTPGYSGAELANLVNEAAISAVRSAEDVVTMHHLMKALEKTKSYRRIYSSNCRTTVEVD